LAEKLAVSLVAYWAVPKVDLMVGWKVVSIVLKLAEVMVV
jgi:hypothetical protein